MSVVNSRLLKIFSWPRCISSRYSRCFASVCNGRSITDGCSNRQSKIQRLSHAAIRRQQSASVLTHQHARRCCSSHQTRCDVHKFGELRVTVGSSCDVTISSLDPHLHLDQNLVIVDDTARRLSVDCRNADGLSRVSLSESEDAEKTRHSGQKSDACDIQVPIKYDLYASVDKHSELKVDFLQNERIDVSTVDGDCQLNKIETGYLTAQTLGGNIICIGLLQGDARFETEGSGHVHVAKPLSRQLNVTTESGDIVVDNLYADHSSFITQNGNISIRNAHRDIAINICQDGNVKIDSLDGSLDARVNNGNVDLLISQHDSINISIKSGDINLKVPTSLQTELDLKADSVTVDKQLDTTSLICTKSDAQEHVTGSVGQSLSSCAKNIEAASTVRAETGRGSITVICQDWVSSLKLGRFMDSEEND